jgi:hypothetical protein
MPKGRRKESAVTKETLQKKGEQQDKEKSKEYEEKK